MPIARLKLYVLYNAQVWICWEGTCTVRSKLIKFKHVYVWGPCTEGADGPWGSLYGEIQCNMGNGQMGPMHHIGSPHEQNNWQMNRHDWKHYLLTASLVGVNKENSVLSVVSLGGSSIHLQIKWLIFPRNYHQYLVRVYYITVTHYTLLAHLIALHKICVSIIGTSFGAVPEIAFLDCDV